MPHAQHTELNPHIPVAAQVQALWEQERGFFPHIDREASESPPAEVLEAYEKLPLESILDTVLDEWLELYEAVLHPEPQEAELLELADIGAYALRFYTLLNYAQRPEQGTFSQEEARQYNAVIAQAFLSGEAETFPAIERTVQQREGILNDLRVLGVEILQAYTHLVGAELSREELAELIQSVDFVAQNILDDNREMTPSARAGLRYLVMRPVIKATPGEKATRIHAAAKMDIVAQVYDALDAFAHKHYDYDYYWTLVASLYAQGGKNAQNYPHPLPDQYVDHRDFKTTARSQFPGRVIPPDYDPYQETPAQYKQRWEQANPGKSFDSDYQITARVPRLGNVSSQLR